MDSLESLREQVAATRPHHPSRGYPLELRLRVSAYARRRIAAGALHDAVAGELGVSRTGLRNWLRAASPPGGRALVPVQLSTEPPAGLPPATCPRPIAAGTPTLISPRGFRVEGLAVADLETLLARLG